MALTGNWKASVAIEAPARNNLGTGWNPVHAIRSGDGRSIAPNTGGLSTIDEVVPIDYEHEGPYDDPAGSDVLGAYDATDAIVWGYSPDDGTADRPSWEMTTPQFRGDSTLPDGVQPEWGPYTNGIPGGTIARDRSRGAENTKRTKVRPTETVAEGWENKQHLDTPQDAEQSDVSQLYMQTSMTQRDKVREGSQAQSGRDNADRAPIASRIVGMRMKFFSDSAARRYDMTPRQAEERIRPWWNRQAGTADPSLMDPNAMQVRQPISRNVPAEPDQGVNSPTDTTTTDTYGYVSEDAIPYA